MDAANAGLGEPPMGLFILPNEILGAVCRTFCWHYQGLTKRHLDIFHGMCAQRTDSGEMCVDKRRRGLDLIPVRLDGYSLGECWRTLSWLSQSCKRLRSIAEPTLYHSIFVSRSRLPLLVRTLEASPVLASEIVDLYIHGEKAPDRPCAGPAQISFLIQKAVILRRLHLAVEEPAFFSALSQSIANWLTFESGEGGRQQLEYLGLDPEIKHWVPRYSRREDHGRMIDGNEASPLFRLAGTKLKTLRCRSPIYSTLKTGLKLDNIVELSLCQNWAEANAPNGLDQCALTLPRLRNLLGAVGRGLQRLSISRHPNNLRDLVQRSPDDRLVELQDVLSELLEWKDTLRELVFEGDLAQFRRKDEIIVRSGVGDLAKFRKLEVLAIRGREYFDPSTKRHGDGETVSFEDFIAALSSRLQHLHISGIVLIPLRQILRQIFEDAGETERQFPCLRLVQVDADAEKYWTSVSQRLGITKTRVPMEILGKISSLGQDLAQFKIAFDRWEDLGWRDEWLTNQT